jgi:hypothetical protein
MVKLHEQLTDHAQVDHDQALRVSLLVVFYSSTVGFLSSRCFAQLDDDNIARTV